VGTPLRGFAHPTKRRVSNLLEGESPLSQTENLGLPLILAEQAQKHVTHNEALRALDALAQLSVKDRDLTAAPGSPANGDRYIVGDGATGAWAGRDLDVAAWQDGAWAFHAPAEGWRAWIEDEALLAVFDGAAWEPFGGSGAITELQDLDLLGVGTEADATNPFSVEAGNVLLSARYDADGGDGSFRQKLNKESAADTVSQLFQTNFSGRAEYGLVGDDDFHIKVSPDGSSWKDAFTIDRTTGIVALPQGTSWSREKLSGNRTYYVRNDGSDSNTGLANSAGGAFLTIQKAVDAAAAIDLGGFTATIQVGAGTYTGAVTLKNLVAGEAIVVGDETTPANVFINVTGACFNASEVSSVWNLRGMKLQASGTGIVAFTGARVNFQNLDFGACPGGHINLGDGAMVTATGNYTISGNAANHTSLTGFCMLRIQNRTVTLTGTPAFGSRFLNAQGLSYALVTANTYSGSATGQRYNVSMNAVIFTNGAGATYLPGNSAGAAATGGQYL
jgi:hypothetical protein